MDAVPIIPEFVQYGAIGIAVVAIVALCFVTRLFVNAFMQFAQQIITLNDTISKLSAKLDSMVLYHKRRKQEDTNDDGT